LYMAQLMPLPLTVSCFSKIQFGFTFLVPTHPGSPGQRAVKRECVCVCSTSPLPWLCDISAICLHVASCTIRLFKLLFAYMQMYIYLQVNYTHVLPRSNTVCTRHAHCTVYIAVFSGLAVTRHFQWDRATPKIAAHCGDPRPHLVHLVHGFFSLPDSKTQNSFSISSAMLARLRLMAATNRQTDRHLSRQRDRQIHK